ncbi:hypothetical protein EIP91_009354 [Steccherinum ochraceum]|uniref:Uncharacterized protein n=1 Tax=Steccherinum ochraceum TaxID=92696 RepID=A0A4R0RZZ0_9APHY|nr:hypothetical protein EIP91_009354 [Steccherinum ochraceum]
MPVMQLDGFIERPSLAAQRHYSLYGGKLSLGQRFCHLSLAYVSPRTRYFSLILPQDSARPFPMLSTRPRTRQQDQRGTFALTPRYRPQDPPRCTLSPATAWGNLGVRVWRSPRWCFLRSTGHPVFAGYSLASPAWKFL